MNACSRGHRGPQANGVEVARHRVMLVTHDLFDVFQVFLGHNQLSRQQHCNSASVF